MQKRAWPQRAGDKGNCYSNIMTGEADNPGHNFRMRQGGLSPDPSLPPSQLKFNFYKNLMKPKISLHNSSNQINRSVYSCISMPLWYYMAHFPLSFSLDFGELAPTLPPPPGFCKLTPLLRSVFEDRNNLREARPEASKQNRMYI